MAMKTSMIKLAVNLIHLMMNRAVNLIYLTMNRAVSPILLSLLSLLALHRMLLMALILMLTVMQAPLNQQRSRRKTPLACEGVFRSQSERVLGHVHRLSSPRSTGQLGGFMPVS
jgi:hypothetical protein